MLLLRGIYYVDRTQLGLQKTLFAQAEWLTIFMEKSIVLYLLKDLIKVTLFSNKDSERKRTDKHVWHPLRI